jgi:cupin 2 domain-containing protein
MRRFDVTTNDWVIFAPNRSSRPRDFQQRARPAPPDGAKVCPFCPGNEHLTPPAVFAVRDGRAPFSPGWKVRVMPNLLSPIPASTPEELTETLLNAKCVRIKRIVSQDHASPPEFWYDQHVNERVLLIQGASRLKFESEAIEMKAAGVAHAEPVRCRSAKREATIPAVIAPAYPFQENGTCHTETSH